MRLDQVEAGLRTELTQASAATALHDDVERIADAARSTAALAGLAPSAIDALYLTGGSTGLRLLRQRFIGLFPAARLVHGDRFSSVATGLGLHAWRRFEGARHRD
jgi:hypothetical chaperone protein